MSSQYIKFAEKNHKKGTSHNINKTTHKNRTDNGLFYRHNNRVLRRKRDKSKKTIHMARTRTLASRNKLQTNTKTRKLDTNTSRTTNITRTLRTRIPMRKLRRQTTSIHIRKKRQTIRPIHPRTPRLVTKLINKILIIKQMWPFKDDLTKRVKKAAAKYCKKNQGQTYDVLLTAGYGLEYKKSIRKWKNWTVTQRKPMHSKATEWELYCNPFYRIRAYVYVNTQDNIITDLTRLEGDSTKS